MIKDMRRELAACRDDSWRLDEASELGDMKERLFMSMLPHASASAACGAEPGPEPGAASVASGFAALSMLNDEMDQELESLMVSHLHAPGRGRGRGRGRAHEHIYVCKCVYLYVLIV